MLVESIDIGAPWTGKAASGVGIDDPPGRKRAGSP
jgi:hypothetical protein